MHRNVLTLLLLAIALNAFADPGFIWEVAEETTLTALPGELVKFDNFFINTHDEVDTYTWTIRSLDDSLTASFSSPWTASICILPQCFAPIFWEIPNDMNPGLRDTIQVDVQAPANMVEDYSDIIQIGTRNMQNFSLLRRAGEAKKPIFLKRGMSATVDEWLMAAEYIMAEGNPEVILCERGVRTFVRHSRNTLDLSAVPVVQKESHLPIMVDPSHAAGYRDQVIPLARAAAAVNAHGMMIEVHNEPEKASSDGAQSLYPKQFETLCRQIRAIEKILKETDAS